MKAQKLRYAAELVLSSGIRRVVEYYDDVPYRACIFAPVPLKGLRTTVLSLKSLASLLTRSGGPFRILER